MKIKTPYAKIIVGGTPDKPYYDILWYDTEKQQWYIGYGSYCIHNVFKWLKEEFEVTGNIFQFPDIHAHWINNGYACGETEWKCSECGKSEWRTTQTNYCPNCGARMDGAE